MRLINHHYCTLLSHLQATVLLFRCLVSDELICRLLRCASHSADGSKSLEVVTTLPTFAEMAPDIAPTVCVYGHGRAGTEFTSDEALRDEVHLTNEKHFALSGSVRCGGNRCKPPCSIAALATLSRATTLMMQTRVMSEITASTCQLSRILQVPR